LGLQAVFLKNFLKVFLGDYFHRKENLDFWEKIVYNKGVIFSMKTEKTLLNDISVCADSVGEKKL